MSENPCENPYFMSMPLGAGSYFAIKVGRPIDGEECDILDEALNIFKATIRRDIETRRLRSEVAAPRGEAAVTPREVGQ